MAWRNHANRCEECGLNLRICMCAEIPRLETDARLVLLIHRRELFTSTNTGRLATKALVNSEMRLRGIHPDPMDDTGLPPAEGQAFLMFPSESARVLDREWLETYPKPWTLIVPDGNWRQASKVAKREKCLAGLPHVVLPMGAPTGYSELRTTSREGGLATLEAIARAFGILENAETQTALEKVFAMSVERHLFARGQLKRHECRWPPEAKFP